MFDDDLADLSAEDRHALQEVMVVVTELAPDATEGRSYGLPAFRYRDKPLLGFAVTQTHLSLYPFSPAAVDAVRGDLDGFKLSKGAVRFTADTPLPRTAVEAMVRARMAEIDGA